MRAFRVVDFNAPPRFETIALPEPRAGEVRLKITAAGLNFADLLMCKGRYQDTPPVPFTLGLEVAGVVDALGAGVSALRQGDRVAVYGGSGGMAEYGCFPADHCMALPDTMSDVDAAGLLIAYGTSHLALIRRGRLAAGERLVVLGAAGGVGLTAVELGAAIGAEVVAVARGAEKLAVAQAAGAHHLIDSDSPDLRDQLRALGGVDVLYDAVGGAAFQAAFRAMRPEGRVLAIGFASGDVPQIPANHLLVKNIEVIGVYFGGYLKFAPDALFESLRAVIALHGQGAIKPHQGAVLPFDQAPEALALLEARKSTGKIILRL